MRLISTTLMLLVACPFCYANGYTLSDANHIIALLLVFVIVLIVLGCYSLYYNRIISQRNEQLRRILTALDSYRAMVGDDVLSLDEQEEVINKKLLRMKNSKMVQEDDNQSFFVMMDSRINKERPFTDPNFDQEALEKFMGVNHDTFCKLVPRYTDPARTQDYINSLRAEYAAKILMEQPDFPTDDIVSKCGFKNAAAFHSAFRFALGITPADLLGGMKQMFKKKQQN